MTRKFSVTAACNAANKFVGKPVKFGQTSWQVFFHEPGETASRAMQADSYAKALKMMVETKALIAIELLADACGYSNDYDMLAMLEIELTNGAKWRDAVKTCHRAAVGK